MAIQFSNTTPTQPVNTLPVSFASDTSGNISASVVLIAPNMTTTQKNALSAVAGQIVFDTTLVAFSGFNGSAWVAL